MPDLHASRCDQQPERERRDQPEALGDEQHPPLVEAIRNDPGEWADRDRGNCSCEAQQPEQRRRFGQDVHDPDSPEILDGLPEPGRGKADPVEREVAIAKGREIALQPERGNRLPGGESAPVSGIARRRYDRGRRPRRHLGLIAVQPPERRVRPCRPARCADQRTGGADERQWSPEEAREQTALRLGEWSDPPVMIACWPSRSAHLGRRAELHDRHPRHGREHVGDPARDKRHERQHVVSEIANATSAAAYAKVDRIRSGPAVVAGQASASSPRR